MTLNDLGLRASVVAAAGEDGNALLGDTQEEEGCLSRLRPGRPQTYTIGPSGEESEGYGYYYILLAANA